MNVENAMLDPRLLKNKKIAEDLQKYEQDTNAKISIDKKQLQKDIISINESNLQQIKKIADVDYDSNYVSYQKDGLQELDSQISMKDNIFRLGEGNQEVRNKFINSGLDFYNNILTRGVNLPTASQSLGGELKYGDYNYIAPLNRGMINPEYTFVSPTNWYPIPPHPPVCVTNKNCVTSPVIISDGSDYMNYANWDEFDKSRRFTGNMNINLDYVKNVLNNCDGF